MIIVVAMGVSGSGKTTIGRAIAAALGAEFLEGDKFHPAANIAKMSRGEPLDDADRWPWLDRMADALARAKAEGRSVVLASSALKRSYRDRLRRGAPDLRIVYLKGDKELIRRRIEARKHHFMPPGLLDSQFAALEEPGSDESPVVIDVTPPLDILMGQLPRIVEALLSSARPVPY
ncbi:MAG TPA: gluconokinase [Stellaceae bacterium]|nr:gluconokinase [Stellaceae bacterium]